MILLILTDKIWYKLGYLRHFTHMFSILEWIHFIGILSVIIDIYDIFVNHTVSFFTPESDYHEP